MLNDVFLIYTQLGWPILADFKLQGVQDKLKLFTIWQLLNYLEQLLDRLIDYQK